MALSPFKAPQSPLSRSRSSSCSSPIRNRIVYQEVYSIGHNTLVRSYSCDQVFDKDETGRTYQTTQIQVSSFITPDKKMQIPSERNTPKEGRKLVFESPKPEKEKSDETELKMESNELSSPSRTLKKNLLLLLLTIMSACVVYFYISLQECRCVWDLKKTELDLKENIFGQDKAVDKINSVLRVFNTTIDTHVMVFTGGVGVGKTYSSSLISRNFPWRSKKLFPKLMDYLTGDLEKYINEKLTNCGCNLVTIDNLSAKSVSEVMQVTDSLRSKRDPNENLLIILIFQTRTDEEKTEIMKEMKKHFVNAHYISFETLAKEDVEKCFQFEIKRQGVSIPNSDLRNLVEERMKHIDIVRGPTGCKGVSIDVASYYKKTLI